MKTLNKSPISIILLIITFSICCISIGFSTFSKKILTDNFITYVRPDLNVRITSFSTNSTSNNGQALNNDYNVSSVFSDITLPNNNSTITYSVTVKNYGNTEMGIKRITLPSELEEILNVSISNYEVGKKLRNNDNSCEESVDGCKLSIERTFEITISYDSGAYNSNQTSFTNFRLDFEFVKCFSVTYTGFTLTNPAADINATSVLDGNTYAYNIGEHQSLTVLINGVATTDYTIDQNNYLVVPNVDGNLEIVIVEVMIPIEITAKYPENATIKYTINGNTEQTTSKKLNINVPKGSTLSIEVSHQSTTINFESYSETFTNITEKISKEITLSGTCEVRFIPEPSTATIAYKINGGASQSTTGTLIGTYAPGTEIEVTVSNSGYKTSETKTYTITEHKDYTIKLTPVYTVTINTEPTGANLKYAINGGSEKTATSPLKITDVKGTTISVIASKDGYKTSDSKTYTIDSTTSHTIILAKVYTYTVKEQNNRSSSILLEYNGTSKLCSTATSCSVQVPSGTSVKYTISADYYTTQTSTDTITDDYTRKITLVKKTPITATIASSNCSCSSCDRLSDGCDGKWNTWADSSFLTSTSKSYTFNYTSKAFQDAIPADGELQSVTATYTIDATVSPYVNVTATSGSTQIGYTRFEFTNVGEKEFDLTCTTSIASLRANGARIVIQFEKTFAALGYWYEAEFNIKYIPK